MADRGITLQRQASELVFVANRGDAFRLKVIATAASQMPAEVFGHQRQLIDPSSGTAGDEFCFVCSPFDLSVYPANEPDDDQFPSFFRKNSIDVLLPSSAAVEDAWLAIQEEVSGLVSAMNRMEWLTPAETVRIGAANDEETSLSESSLSA